jgi:hypothetical protein
MRLGNVMQMLVAVANRHFKLRNPALWATGHRLITGWTDADRNGLQALVGARPFICKA